MSKYKNLPPPPAITRRRWALEYPAGGYLTASDGKVLFFDHGADATRVAVFAEKVIGVTLQVVVWCPSCQNTAVDRCIVHTSDVVGPDADHCNGCDNRCCGFCLVKRVIG